MRIVREVATGVATFPPNHGEETPLAKIYSIYLSLPRNENEQRQAAGETRPQWACLCERDRGIGLNDREPQNRKSEARKKKKEKQLHGIR